MADGVTPTSGNGEAISELEKYSKARFEEQLTLNKMGADNNVRQDAAKKVGETAR